jgi:acyl carrier protein
MQTADIDREVRNFVVTHFLSGRADRLRADGLLLGDVIDSTGVIELISYLQERFAITVEDDEVTPDNLSSMDNIVALVAKKLQNAHA